MRGYRSGEGWELYIGDCLNVMRAAIPDNSVDSIVTDPPYELGFMGKNWDKSGVAYNVEVWREALRVLKPGGHLLSFGGSRTYHRMACAIEDAGFEIRDQIMWVYGSGFPKSHNLDGEWDGWGTALKPAHEPIVVARKPLIGTVAANVSAHGTGALNIDGCRVVMSQDDAGYIETRIGGFNNTRSIGGNGAYSGGETMDRAASYDASKGRWPADFIHDGSDEVMALFPTTTRGKPCGTKAGNNNNVFGQYAGGIPVTGFGDSGSAARFFYCAKTTKKDRNEGLDGFIPTTTSDGRAVAADNAYQRGKTERANHHPTVKPTDLMRYLCRLVTPPGGVVVDLFTGSGSTGKAAILESFRFIGIERDLDENGEPLGYADIAVARLTHASQTPPPPQP